jgi:uncharacterized membrane protein YcjF (UPF0283 family)
MMDFHTLKEFQDNGGIVIAIIAVVLVVGVVIGITFILVRTSDWLKIRKEIKQVAKTAAANLGIHEINQHMEETLHRATVERLTEIRGHLEERIADKKAAKWGGPDRRAA